MKRGFKDIEHKVYTAPGGKRRKFLQRAPIRRLISLASRYVQFLSDASYGAMDRFVSQLIAEGSEEASRMARRKFHAHRPKPANNKAKNKARRHSHVLKLGAVTPGNKPEPAIRINATQVRANQAVLAGWDLRAIRSITRDRRSGGHGSSWFVGVRDGARECERRRRQMESKAKVAA